jgi:antitoxin component YwqK of YwqJK toxin-antitoxin module
LVDISLHCWNSNEGKTEKIKLLQTSTNLIKSGENFDFEQLFKINETFIEGYVLKKEEFYNLYNCKKSGKCVEIREINNSKVEDYSGKFKEIYKGKIFKYCETEYFQGEKHGKYLEFYEDGKIKKESYYHKNNIVGFDTEYHNNGRKSLERYYRNDKIGTFEGNFTTWDSNGVKTSEATYLNGIITKKEKFRNRILIEHTLYTDLGKEKKIIEYDDNGNKRKKTTYY